LHKLPSLGYLTYGVVINCLDGRWLTTNTLLTKNGYLVGFTDEGICIFKAFKSQFAVVSYSPDGYLTADWQQSFLWVYQWAPITNFFPQILFYFMKKGNFFGVV